MKFSAVTVVMMLSYFAFQDKTPWGPKKAEILSDEVSSASRAKAIAQGPQNKDISADAPVPRPPLDYGGLAEKVDQADLKEGDSVALAGELKAHNARKAEGGATFPWQTPAQAKPALASVSRSVQKSPDASRGEDRLTRPMPKEEASGYAANQQKTAALGTAQTWKGADSLIENFRTVVITTPSEWKTLWRLHARAAVPSVDFNHDMVIGVFAGTREDLWSVDIQSIEVQADNVVVTYQDHPLPPEAGVAAPTNRPYELRVIAKSSLPVRFNQTSRYASHLGIRFDKTCARLGVAV